MTSLFGNGTRVSKSHLQIHVLGGLDEINSQVGLALAMLDAWIEIYQKQQEDKMIGELKKVRNELRRCQSDLFFLGSQVAKYRRVELSGDNNKEGESGVVRGADAGTDKSVVIDEGVWFKRAEQIEFLIDQMEADLPRLDLFILPGVSILGAQLHLVRAVVRRVERDMVRFAHPAKKGTPQARVLVEEGMQGWLVYLNRLSDWLFVAARFVNKTSGLSETVWNSADKGE